MRTVELVPARFDAPATDLINRATLHMPLKDLKLGVRVRDVEPL